MPEFELPHHHGEQNQIDNIYTELQATEHFNNASDLFKQLSDPTRVRIFWVLCHREECVINIAALLGMSSPAVSHHLRLLTDSGLVISRRSGKETYYKVADTKIGEHIHEVVEQVLKIVCPRQKGNFQTSNDEIVKKVHEYMTMHISDRITIEELGKMFLINTTTLKKVFKDIYGNSIAEHMKMHRLEKATQLLSSTKNSITSIAKEIGYESQSRFTSSFKKRYGMLPTEYRKKNFKTEKIRDVK